MRESLAKIIKWTEGAETRINKGYKNSFYGKNAPEQPAQVNTVDRVGYFNAMKKRNPNATDDEINSYLDKKGVK